MSYRSRRTVAAAIATSTLAASVFAGGVAFADPNWTAAGGGSGTTGDPLAGKGADQLIAGVGSDALENVGQSIAAAYDSDPSHAAGPFLESYNATNPSTGATGAAETITTKPGIAAIARPNGGNAGITALNSNNTPTVVNGKTVFPVDYVRQVGDRNPTTQAQDDFYVLGGDVVTYAYPSGGDAPASLTKAQLVAIFTGVDTTWNQVDPSLSSDPIKVYLPSSSAAVRSAFEAALGVTDQQVTIGLGSNITTVQQNSGQAVTDKGGIVPYAAGKYVSQTHAVANGAVVKGVDPRGTVVLGSFDGVAPTITQKDAAGTDQTVANYPGYLADNATSLVYDVVRNDRKPVEGTTLAVDAAAPFTAAGWICSNQLALLPAEGEYALGSDTTQTHYCGQKYGAPAAALTAGTISVSSPAAGGFLTQGRDVTLAATIDDTYGVAVATYAVDNQAAVPLNRTGTTSYVASFATSGLAVGTHTVTLRETPGIGPSSGATATVTFTLTPSGALVPGKYSASGATKKGKNGFSAAKYPFKGGPSGKGEQATKKKQLTYATYGKTIVLHLAEGPKAGKVNIVVNGKTVKKLDLYSAKAKDFTVTLKESKASNTVALAALGQHSKKSKGTTVLLGWLQIKA